MDDTEEAERDSRRGQETPLKVDPKLVHDVQLLVSRLAAKAPKLLGNQIPPIRPKPGCTLDVSLMEGKL